MTRLLRWFLAHDPTTACQLDPAAVVAENRMLKQRLDEARIQLHMQEHAAELLAGLNRDVS